MNVKTDRMPRHARLVAGVAIGVAALLIYGWAAWLLSAHADARRQIEDIDARYLRLSMLQDAQPALEAALEAASRELNQQAYPATTDADRVGADLQQRVRALAAEAGLGVIGSQILAPRPSDSFQRVSLMATLDGTVEQVHHLLGELALARPLIHVEQVVIQHLNARNTPSANALRVQLSLVSFHALP